MSIGTVEMIIKNKIILILRGVPASRAVPLAEALYNGGVRLMEVTFDQRAMAEGIREACYAIKKINDAFGEKICVGAGTVLSCDQVRAAAEAGAKYMISPNADFDVIRATKELGLISIPGALSPTEIIAAHKAGADFVKLFPADSLGLKYAKAVMAPVNHIPMLAVGGVDETNLKDFLQAGFLGVGVGGSIVKKDLLKSGAYGEITELALKYTSQI